MNKLLTSEQAAKEMLKIARKQIDEMKKDGFTDKEIQEVFDKWSAELFYGR